MCIDIAVFIVKITIRFSALFVSTLYIASYCHLSLCDSIDSFLKYAVLVYNHIDICLPIPSLGTSLTLGMGIEIALGMAVKITFRFSALILSSIFMRFP